jgi:hypothetical protein
MLGTYISIPLAHSGVYKYNCTFFFLDVGSTRHRAFADTVQYNLRKEGYIYILAGHR